MSLLEFAPEPPLDPKQPLYTLEQGLKDLQAAIDKKTAGGFELTGIDPQVIARQAERIAFKVGRSFMDNNHVAADNYLEFSISDKSLQTTRLLTAQVGEALAPVLQQVGVTANYDAAGEKLTKHTYTTNVAKYSNPEDKSPDDWRELSAKLTEHLGEPAAQGLRRKLQDAALLGLYETSSSSWSPVWRHEHRSDARNIPIMTALLLDDPERLPPHVRKLAETATSPMLTQGAWPVAVTEYEEQSGPMRLAYQIKRSQYYAADDLMDGNHTAATWHAAADTIAQIAGPDARSRVVNHLQSETLTRLIEVPPAERSAHAAWLLMKNLVGAEIHPQLARLETENDFSNASCFSSRVDLLNDWPRTDRNDTTHHTYMVSRELPLLLAETPGPRTDEAITKLFQYQHRTDIPNWQSIAASPHLPAVVDGMFARIDGSVAGQPKADITEPWKDLLAAAENEAAPVQPLHGVTPTPPQPDRVRILRHLDRMTDDGSNANQIILNQVAEEFRLGLATPREVRRMLGDWQRASNTPAAIDPMCTFLDEHSVIGIRSTDDRRNGSRMRRVLTSIREDEARSAARAGLPEVSRAPQKT